MDPDDVKALLNRTGAYPAPIRDGKLIACVQEGQRATSKARAQGAGFFVFKPQGFLIVTRPIFEGVLERFLEWKFSQGFEPYVVTAEWIQLNVAGSDLRLKIRNCLRYYHAQTDLKYVMLIGDSVDLAYDTLTQSYEDPPAVLSENWNLPVGYYRWDTFNIPQFTTLYCSDLSNKLTYPVDEYYWDGDYQIFVGVVPVRTPKELGTNHRNQRTGG